MFLVCRATDNELHYATCVSTVEPAISVVVSWKCDASSEAQCILCRRISQREKPKSKSQFKHAAHFFAHWSVCLKWEEGIPLHFFFLAMEVQGLHDNWSNCINHLIVGQINSNNILHCQMFYLYLRVERLSKRLICTSPENIPRVALLPVKQWDSWIQNRRFLHEWQELMTLVKSSVLEVIGSNNLFIIKKANSAGCITHLLQCLRRCVTENEVMGLIPPAAAVFLMEAWSGSARVLTFLHMFKDLQVA